jgi:chromosome segregation ATPase
MGRIGLSRLEILQACQDLERKGIKVTNARVKDHLGRGSFATIGPVVKAYKMKLDDAKKVLSANEFSQLSHYKNFQNVPGVPPINSSANSAQYAELLQSQELDEMPEELVKSTIKLAKEMWQASNRICDEKAQEKMSQAIGQFSGQMSNLPYMGKNAEEIEKSIQKLLHENQQIKEDKKRLENQVSNKNTEVSILSKQLMRKEREAEKLVERAISAEKELELLKREKEDRSKEKKSVILRKKDEQGSTTTPRPTHPPREYY